MSALEQWKPVRGYEGIYEVSSHGRVRSVGRTITCSDGQVRHLKGKVLRTTLSKRGGYPEVSLYAQGKRERRYVHSLVAEAFFGTRPKGMEVCHNDGDPTNNHLDNLRYGTRSDNMLDRVRHGTNPSTAKTHCPQGHELSAENNPPSSAKLGWRGCLACIRARARVQRHPELKPQMKAIADSYYHAILNNRRDAA